MPDIILSIPDERLQIVKDSIFELRPIPSENNPSTELPWTEEEWLERVIIKVLVNFVKTGRRKIRFREDSDAFEREESDFDDSFDIT